MKDEMRKKIFTRLQNKEPRTELESIRKSQNENILKITTDCNSSYAIKVAVIAIY